jgi:hypothetical protein
MLSAFSGAVHRDLRQTNTLFFLFPIELLALPFGGAAAGRILQSRRDLAPGMLGVGVYLIAVAGAMSTIYSMWLPEDDTILGSALLAGLWAGVGANLALASAASGHAAGLLVVASLFVFWRKRSSTLARPSPSYSWDPGVEASSWCEEAPEGRAGMM